MSIIETKTERVMNEVRSRNHIHTIGSGPFRVEHKTVNAVKYFYGKTLHEANCRRALFLCLCAELGLNFEGKDNV